MKTLLFVRTRPLESNTSSSIRARSTVDLLYKCGYSVTVLTTDVDFCGDEIRYEGVEKTIRIPMSGSYNYVRTANKGTQKKSIIQEIRNFVITKIKSVYRKVIVIDPLKLSVSKLGLVLGQLAPKYDVIVSCSDPKSSHLLAHEVIKKGIKYDKFIEFWGDPLLLDISRKFYVPRLWVKHTEKKLLGRADLIYYVSPFTMEAQKALFVDYAEKMRCLVPAYQNVRIATPVREIKKIGYFGDYFSSIRNILPLYNAVRKTKYKLAIYGASDVELQEVDNITVHGRIPREEMIRIEDDTDLLVCLCNNSGTQIPGKIYQYAATNKPILLIKDGDVDLELFFGQYNRFVFAENNEESIINALSEIDERDLSNLSPIHEFSVEYQIPEMAKEIVSN